METDRLDKLNDDCLLHIFKYFGLPTLAELSFTCQKIQRNSSLQRMFVLKIVHQYPQNVKWVRIDNCYQPRRTQKLHCSLGVVRNFF